MKTFICADSFEWLPANRDQGSVVTSLPDASEIGIEDLDEYDKWVRRAATEIFLSASEGCPVIFIQTDRRKDGRQFSKANLLINIARSRAGSCSGTRSSLPPRSASPTSIVPRSATWSASEG